jgi:tRNA A37 threonylcarbamoyladenosine dehydratase
MAGQIMLNEFSRTELLLGALAMQKLQEATVAVFGIGGVGSYTVEALARSGVGGFALFDDDKVCLTNINRQLIATRKTVGKPKVEAMRDRILEINPSANVTLYPTFYTAENADEVDLSQFSYVVDAIDTVSSKLTLIEKAKAAGVPIISCMGAGNKLDPTKFEVADIYSTSVCPLARIMRNELRKRDISSLKVVYSKEPPLTPIEDDANSCKHHCICPPGTKRKCTIRRQVPGSTAFVPSVAGLILAGEVVKDLIRLDIETES